MTAMIKVLYFLNSTVRAGVEEHLLGLLRHIDRQVFKPVVVCPQELLDMIGQELNKLNVPYYPVCIRRWRHIAQIRSFLRILKEEKPDIVHAHLFFATMFAAPLSKKAGVRAVIETAHIREAWRQGIKKMYAIDRFFYRYVDKVVAVSGAVKNYLLREKKLPEEKIEIIRNGVDLQRFPCLPRLEHDHHFTIGVIGRLELQKGHQYFFQALHSLDGEFDNVSTRIVGEGSLRNTLEEMCEQLGIKNKVEFLGFQEDIATAIKGVDVVVLPSLYEGLPLVALEAQAAGRPVVATDVDGSPEVVIHNKTGFVVEPQNSYALKEAIKKLIEEKTLAVTMGEEARKHIEESFDIKNQVRETEELYKRLSVDMRIA